MMGAGRGGDRFFTGELVAQTRQPTSPPFRGARFVTLAGKAEGSSFNRRVRYDVAG